AGAAPAGPRRAPVVSLRGPDGHAHLPHLWAELFARVSLRSGALSDVRDVLVAARRRAAPRPAPGSAAAPPVSAVWRPHPAARPGRLPRLLCVLVCTGRERPPELEARG